MIRAAGVDKRYGRRRAVAGIDLAIDAGERVGLVGPNGAGKSTLLRLLSGFLAPSAGSIEIDGIDVVAEPERAGRRIGYLPEGAPAYVEMRARSFLIHRARLKGLARQDAKAAADRALARVELSNRGRARIATLSRGMRRRLGLAEAMLAEPPVLLLDEPTSGLDPAQLRQLTRTVEALAVDRALVFSSHRLGAVEALCDRIVAVSRGSIAFDGAPGDMIAAAGTSADLEAAFLALTAVAGGEEE